MFRVLGFLIGSATSIAVILLVTGIPDFHLEDPVIDQKRFDAAVEKLMARKDEVELSANDGLRSEESWPEKLSVKAPTESVPIELPSPDDDPDVQSTEVVSQAASQPAENAQVPAKKEISFIAPGNSQPLLDTLWYSFWNPFRSEIAANGFVSQLEKVTGLDYRVVKIKTGVYEVAFAYDDDQERRNKLLQISAATGLDLPDS